MRILIFGTGDYYERYKKWLIYEEVLALLDNSPEKQGKKIDGIQVVSPKEGLNLPYDKIIILSFYIKEMKKQLLDLRVDINNILHFYDLHDFLNSRIPYYPMKASDTAKKILNNECEKQKTLLLLSTDMLQVGGPAKVLFNVGKVLIKNGYSVMFASMIDGVLKNEIEKAGIPVVIDENLQIATMEEIEWIKGFRLIICNTINFYVFLSKRNCEIPVIWWLHDSSFFYEGVNEKILNGISLKNLKLASVGSVPREAMNKIAPHFKIGNLIYGIENKEDFTPHNSSFKICFATIGYIEERKGQDLLIEAIRILPKSIRKRIKVYIIGKNDSALAHKIAHEILDLPEVVMTGVLDTLEFEKIFCCLDVLICSSREDPMPAVVSEAMMKGIPCIVSDSTGTADYIRDGIEGWIFQNGNAFKLAEKIKWCVEHRDLLYNIGVNAKKIFKTNFSMEIFEKNLLSIVEESLRSDAL